MLRLRIACVRYLNTVPLIEGLDKLAACELIPTVPARIAGMIESGAADIGLASIIDAAAGNLALLPVGMIGCDGPTLTVRLFSEIPLDNIDTVHADTDSHTSVMLCRLLLAHLHGRRPRIVDFDVRERVAIGEPEKAKDLDEAWPRSVLLIGDKVVTDSPRAARYPHQLDLGEAWKKLTGLPFVYATWMCRADRADDPSIHTAAAILDRQLRHNQTRLDWIVAASAREHRWPEDLARRYLGELLRFTVGDLERDAVSRFFSMAAAEGLIDMAEPRWVELAAAGVM
jgi:predicted solute-binding protein